MGVYIPPLPPLSHIKKGKGGGPTISGGRKSVGVKGNGGVLSGDAEINM